jgi:hypothetical protein
MAKCKKAHSTDWCVWFNLIVSDGPLICVGAAGVHAP